MPPRRPPLVVAVLLAAALALVAVVAAPPAIAVGSDPFLPDQWGLTQIGARAAWSGGALTGDGVPVAVIDTGVDLQHEDLAGRIVAQVTCVGTGTDPSKCKVDGSDIN